MISKFYSMITSTSFLASQLQSLGKMPIRAFPADFLVEPCGGVGAESYDDVFHQKIHRV
jgi:hypothetical protein